MLYDLSAVFGHIVSVRVVKISSIKVIVPTETKAKRINYYNYVINQVELKYLGFEILRYQIETNLIKSKLTIKIKKKKSKIIYHHSIS